MMFTDDDLKQALKELIEEGLIEETSEGMYQLSDKERRRIDGTCKL